MIRQGFATVELAAFLPTHKLVTNKNVCNEKKGDEDVRDVKKQIVRLELKIKKPTAPLPSIIPNKRAETSSRAQSFSFDNEKKQKKKRKKAQKQKQTKNKNSHGGSFCHVHEIVIVIVIARNLSVRRRNKKNIKQ